LSKCGTVIIIIINIINSCWNLGRFQCVSHSASEWSWQEDLLDFWWQQRD